MNTDNTNMSSLHESGYLEIFIGPMYASTEFHGWCNIGYFRNGQKDIYIHYIYYVTIYYFFYVSIYI